MQHTQSITNSSSQSWQVGQQCGDLLATLDELAVRKADSKAGSTREQLDELLPQLALAIAERVADLEELSAPSSSDFHPRHKRQVTEISAELSRLRRTISRLLSFDAWEMLSSAEMAHLAAELAEQLRAALDGETELYLTMHWDDLGLSE